MLLDPELFPLNARLQRALHAEDAPCAGQRTAQRRLVIQVDLDHFDALARQRRRPACALTRAAGTRGPAGRARPRRPVGLLLR